MAVPLVHRLSRRERQIMDIVYRYGEATVTQVLDAIPDAPSYSAVRALMNILEGKGHLSHYDERGRYVYRPIQPRQFAGLSAIRNVVDTFFAGNTESAVATLLSDKERRMTSEQAARIAHLIADAKRSAGEPPVSGSL